MKKRCKNLARLQMVMKKIENEIDLPQTLKNHTLRGNWNHHRELHLDPDWLLIYKILPKENMVIFIRTGSHSDLFKM